MTTTDNSDAPGSSPDPADHDADQPRNDVAGPREIRAVYEDGSLVPNDRRPIPAPAGPLDWPPHGPRTQKAAQKAPTPPRSDADDRSWASWVIQLIGWSAEEDRRIQAEATIHNCDDPWPELLLAEMQLLFPVAAEAVLRRCSRLKWQRKNAMIVLASLLRETPRDVQKGYSPSIERLQPLCDELSNALALGMEVPVVGVEGSGDGVQSPKSTTPADVDDWVSYDDDRIKSYMGGLDPTNYKGQLRKLAKKYPDIRRDATAADRERLKKRSLHFVYNRRRVYDVTEGRARE